MVTQSIVIGSSPNQNLDIVSVGSLDDINVANGTDLNTINFPDNVDVTLGDSSVISIPVIWSGTSDPIYNGNEDGTYVFSASLVLPNDVINTTNLIANVNVVVGQ